MRGNIWDILTIVTLLALTGLCLVFLTIFTNPYNAINPFPPPTLPPTVAVPTATSTLRNLPSTWTPVTGASHQGQDFTLRPSQTPQPSRTGFVLPSFTPTPTRTSTPTNTSTITLTPTITLNYAATDTYNTAVASQRTLEALYQLQAEAAAITAAVQATQACATLTAASGTP